MKEQYVGDINDYRKYALLRRLQGGNGLRIGVCWMLTPSDGRADGNKTSYLGQPDYERHDPDLYHLLRRVTDGPDHRRLALIENSGTIPSTIYENTIVPDALAARQIWFGHTSANLAATDLIFFDPDNGLEVPSKRKGSIGSSKYLYRDEIAATYANCHSTLVYQHFPREERNAFISRIVADLRTAASGAEVWVFRTAHVAFLLLIHPRHHDVLHASAQSVASFDPKFLSGEMLHASV